MGEFCLYVLYPHFLDAYLFSILANSLVLLLFLDPTSCWKGDLELSFSRPSSSWSMPDPRLLPPLVFMSQNCPPPRTEGTRRSSLFGERWKMGIENFSQKTMTTTMLTRPSHFLPHDDHGQAEPPTSIEIVLKNKDENVHNPYSSTGFPAESLSLQVLLFRHSLAAS